MNLGWSDNVGGEKREHAVELMLARRRQCREHVVLGSAERRSLGILGADAHGTASPTEELFDQAVGKPVLIAPYIEDGASTQDDEATLQPDDPVQQRGCQGDAGPIGQSPAYRFADTFPGTAADPAPATRRADRGPRSIDSCCSRKTQRGPRSGLRCTTATASRAMSSRSFTSRSDQVGVTDETFAKGFSWVADRVHALRGVRVGFTLDALPPDHNASFKPSPKRTGPLLARHTRSACHPAIHPRSVQRARHRLVSRCGLRLRRTQRLAATRGARRVEARLHQRMGEHRHPGDSRCFVGLRRTSRVRRGQPAALRQ